MAQVNITIPDGLQIALARARSEHGTSVLEDLITNWLLDRQKHQRDTDAQVLKANAEGLTPSELASIPPDIRTKLGL